MLTDKQVPTAKPRDKGYKLVDRNSLSLRVSAEVHNSFRYTYRFNGKDQLLVNCAFPDVWLSDGRAEIENTRKPLKEAQNPKCGVVMCFDDEQ